ncbi:MAG: hypothetical protein COA99_09800 [Moraxellaceae bacterium]|nr:MAG: hypothetical protein COA99_09800 [Moraxellaceae bacterium]
MISFKGRHTPKSIVLQCVRWYCSYSLSYRNIEEMMQERGVIVDHSTLNRWVIHYAPKLETAFHKKKRKPGLINIDKSGANKAGIKSYNSKNGRRIKSRQCKYLNNVVEQDRRRIKRITRLMLDFKNFRSAQATLTGIELMAMIKNILGDTQLSS